MHYKRKCLIPSLSIFALLSDIAPVASLQIPFSNSKHIRRDESTVDVTLPDIGFVKAYVCPSKVDLFRRQANGPQTITIPKDQIDTLVLELQMIELQMMAAIKAIDAMLVGDGFISETVVPSTSTPIPLSSEIASSPPEVMTTLETFATSTTTITRTTTLDRTRSRASDVAAPSTAASPDPSIATREPVAATSTTPSIPSNLIAIPASAIVTGTIIAEQQTASSTAIPMVHNTTRYTFNAKSSSNVAVYFGQSPATGSSSLESQCADPNIDIVILAFIVSPKDGGTYPSVNFGAACSGQTDAMRASAPGLLSCPDLAAHISSCQNTYGKKVFLSMGGSTGQISFTSDEEGSAFADVLWQLFGPPGGVDAMLRPFGSVQIDGFDVEQQPNWPLRLPPTLRSHFSTTSKPYYLSSAPQCPFPDASNPTAMLLQCDFVWVQFYNNPSCEIGSSGFDDSVKQWSKALEQSTMAEKPKLYLGVPAWSEAGSSAYGSIGGAKGMEGVVRGVEQMSLVNFGGVMFWDGKEGLLNVEAGMDILTYAKDGLAQSENPS